MREFHRVLRPDGRAIILEFSLPTNRVLRGLYNFYFRRILPRTATLISGDKTGAYKYLPESVNTFIGRKQMMDMLREAGFQEVQQQPDDLRSMRVLSGDQAGTVRIAYVGLVRACGSSGCRHVRPGKKA